MGQDVSQPEGQPQPEESKNTHDLGGQSSSRSSVKMRMSQSNLPSNNYAMSSSQHQKAQQAAILYPGQQTTPDTASHSGPRKQINSISTLINEAAVENKNRTTPQQMLQMKSTQQAQMSRQGVYDSSNYLYQRPIQEASQPQKFQNNQQHSTAVSAGLNPHMTSSNSRIGMTRAVDLGSANASILSTAGQHNYLSQQQEVLQKSQLSHQMKSQLNATKKRRDSMPKSGHGVHQTGKGKLKNSNYNALYEQLMAESSSNKAHLTQQQQRQARHKAPEMVQNPGKVLRRPQANQSNIQGASNSEYNPDHSIELYHQNQHHQQQNSHLGLSSKQQENMQRAITLQDGVNRMKKLKQKNQQQQIYKQPSGQQNSGAQPQKKRRNNNFQQQQAAVIQETNQSKHYDNSKVGKKTTNLKEINTSQNNQRQIAADYGLTRPNAQQSINTQDNRQYQQQQKKNLSSRSPQFGTSSQSMKQQDTLQSLMKNLSPMAKFDPRTIKKMDSHPQLYEQQQYARALTDHNVDSKSDTEYVGKSKNYQENIYLSRNQQEQQQQMQNDYYHQGSSQRVVKRPMTVSQDLDSDKYKKNVFTNMTSRVLDGHRKQEVMASNSWNSLMIKSDRSLPLEGQSRTSFVGLPAMNEVKQSLAGIDMNQGMTFNHVVSSTDLRSMHVSLSNQREIESISMTGPEVYEDIRGSQNWSEHGNHSQRLQQQDYRLNDEIPINYSNNDSIPNNNQMSPEMPSNDQQPHPISKPEKQKKGKISSQQMQRAKEQLRKIQAMENNQNYKINLRNTSSAEQNISNTTDKKVTKSQTDQSKSKGDKMRERRRLAKELINDISPASLNNSRIKNGASPIKNKSSPTRKNNALNKQNENQATEWIQDIQTQQQQPIFYAAPPKRRLIKFGGQESLLDGLIAFTLIQYDPNSFCKMLRLSPNWNYLVLDGMDQAFKSIECDFINKFYAHLLFKRSYTNSSVIYSGDQKGIRLDRVLVCEVLNTAQVNKCLGAHFAYKLYPESPMPTVFGPGKALIKREQHAQASQEHMATYKLDIIKENQKRLIWIHRDQSEDQNLLNESYNPYMNAVNQFDRIKQRPLIQPITQVCVGDVIEIAVNFFSLQGLLDISSVEWFIPQLTEPSKETVLNYDKDRHHQHPDRIMKIHCDLSRICMVEDSVVEWYDADYFQGEFNVLNLDHLLSHFEIVSYQCAGVDGLICKIHLVAKEPGRIDDGVLGIPIVIKLSAQDRFERRKSAISASYNDDGESVLVHEVKRVGFLIDRYVDLQLRLGDALVVYLQRASA